MSGGCARCARRSRLLVRLGMRLDFRARDLARFWELLALGDEELIDAIGGRRRAELRAWHAELDQCSTDLPENVETICRHGGAYPRALKESPLAPHELHVMGGAARLSEMLDGGAVAIVGTRRATDYGMETARALARGLAASGVCVIGALSEGITYAAHAGALEAGGASVTVMAGGVERCTPASCRAVYRRLTRAGGAVSELPCGSAARAWCQPARARTLALLAGLVIVVEAGDSPWELACAHVASSLGGTVAAVPGRISSRASSGANRLLKEGAELVRGPQDALDLLYGVGVRSAPRPHEEIEPRLRATLEQVGEGRDTVSKLTASGASGAEVMLALAELELLGLLVRGDGGRYVPCAGV